MANKKTNRMGGVVYSTSPDFKIEIDEEEIETTPASEQLIKIKLDKKHRGGKVVTLVEGFVLTKDETDRIAKELKTLCGSGGSSKNDEIIIQGDHREKILQWFIKNGFKKSKKL